MRYLLFFMLLVGIFVIGWEGWFKNVSFKTVHAKGPVVMETREFDYFDGLDTGIPGDFQIVQSETPRIELTVKEDLLKIITTEVRNGTLHVSYEGSVSSSGEVLVKVFMPRLRLVDASGAADIKVLSGFAGDDLKLDLSGVGSVDFPEADYGRIQAEVSGSGNLFLGGRAKKLTADISGVGKIDAQKLEVGECKAEISGSGNMDCYVTEKLDADLSGVGNLRYRGNPEVRVKESGASQVRKVD